MTDLPDAEHAGKITVTLFIGSTGNLERTETTESTLTAAQERWLLDRLKQVRLSPGRIADSAVPSKWTLEFALTPDTAASSPSSTSR